MKTVKHILFYSSLFLLTACGCLTKSQVAEIQTYSKLLDSYSEFPGCVVKEFAEIKYEVEQLNTGTFSDTLVHSKLWKSYLGKKKVLKNAERLDIGIKVLTEYASALKTLSSIDKSERLSEQTPKLGTNLDTLISAYNHNFKGKLPVGMGALVSKGLFLFGDTYVKNQQKKIIKQMIIQGDTLISQLTVTTKEELTNTFLNDWIPALKEDLKSRHVNYLQNIPGSSELKVVIANHYNKEVSQLIIKIDDLENMAKQTIKTIETLSRAHHQLWTQVNERKKLSALLTETQKLYSAVKDIYDSYQDILTSYHKESGL